MLGPRGFQPTTLGDKPAFDTQPGGDPIYRLARADLAIFHAEVWDLILDLEALQGLQEQLPASEPRRREILRALSRALDVLDYADVPGTATAARAELAEVLSRPAHASAHRLSAVGHAHIDSAWLWPLRETRRKVARTVSNVATLAEEYPELVFAFSQAQQHAWVRDNYPEVWDRLKKAVAAGNIVPVGGMWVESDTNLPGGEALARQFIHGKRFFLDEYGIDTQEVWLPDSFGYTAALPQLVKLSGSTLVPHPEDLLEHREQVPAPHVLVGGSRRHPGVHALPADRHVQLRPVRPRAGARAAQLRRERFGDPVAGRRSGTATAVAARPASSSRPHTGSPNLEGSPRVDDRAAGRVLRRRGVRVRRGRAGLVR